MYLIAIRRSDCDGEQCAHHALDVDEVAAADAWNTAMASVVDTDRKARTDVTKCEREERSKAENYRQAR